MHRTPRSRTPPPRRAAAAPRPPARRRRRDASAREMLAQFRRHRLDADLGGPRADDDHSRGSALFYGGMVRKKNVGDTVMTSFAITCLVSILWLVFTYSLAFRVGDAVHRRARPRLPAGHRQRHLQGHRQSQSAGADHPRDRLHRCFQLTFAIITPALIAGAFAERMKFSAMLWFIGLWAIFVYAPIAHWVWGPDGILNAANADGLGQGARLRRRHGRAHQFRHRRPDGGARARQAQGHRPRPQHGADLHRRLAAVGRLVRLQRRLGGDRRHAGRHGHAGHAHRDRDRRPSPG